MVPLRRYLCMRSATASYEANLLPGQYMRALSTFCLGRLKCPAWTLVGLSEQGEAQDGDGYHATPTEPPHTRARSRYLCSNLYR